MREVLYYHTMLPILQAQESQLLLKIAMCGAGNMENAAAKEYIATINKQAASREEKRVIDRNVRNVKLAGMGIQVVDLRKNKGAQRR